MSKVISVVNQKGGTGKTTTTVNLGIGLARAGKKVLLIDADPQGSMTVSLGHDEPDDIEITLASIMGAMINEEEIPEDYGIIHHEEGIDFLPANIELSGLEVSLVNVMSRETLLRGYIEMVKKNYDYILIDYSIVDYVNNLAYAADNTISMSFGPAYQSDGTLICYQDSFTSPNGLTDGSSGGTQRRVIIYGDGEEAFCIQPGVPLNTGDQLTANASEAWNALSSAQRAAIKLALAYGKPGNSSELSGSRDSQYIATQMVVWELVNGWRSTSSYERTNNSVYNALCKGGANSEVRLLKMVRWYPLS